MNNIFKNRYNELRSGWSIALVLAVFLAAEIIFSFIVSFLVLILCQGNTEAVLRVAGLPGVGEILESIIYLFEITAMLFLFYFLYKRPLHQMGFVRNHWLTQLLLGGLYGILAIGAVVLILVISGNAAIKDFQPDRILSLGIISGFLKYICVGFCEEILCRGYMMTALKTTRSQWLVLLCPAVLFGLLHILNPNVTLFSIANIVLVGIIFGYLMIKTGRIWASVGLHITWNFFQGNIFGIAVSGSGSGQQALMETVFTGNDWITGGAFGAEGGAVCTVILLLLLAYVHYFVKNPNGAGWSVESDLPLIRKV